MVPDIWLFYAHPRQSTTWSVLADDTTHAGGGIPMVTLSGKVAAQMLLEDIK
jgi:hypothetical protein